MDEKLKKNGSGGTMRASANDSFWDVEFMLPPKKTAGAFVRDTDTVLLEFNHDSIKTEADIPSQEAVKPETAKNPNVEPIITYTPKNPLLHKVAVWMWPSRYNFYERFRTDAEKYFQRTESECPFVEFFSYMPQYMQLTPPQKEFYFWWRQNLRNKVFIKTAYSYIFLFVYEIINLPEQIPAEKGLDMLCDVWLAYREQYPKLDRYLTELVCDYCLINRLTPPYERLLPALPAILAASSFKEFYFYPSSGEDESYIGVLLNFVSNYNWRESKFLTDETAALYDTHINGAFYYAVRKLAEQDRRFSGSLDSMETAKLSRDAYNGSLCSYHVKRRLEIEYASCTRSPELRALITDLVKYIENQIRAIAGIKSRFSTPMLTEKMKETVNEYFLPYRPVKKKVLKREEVSEYEHLYEARSHELSPESALSIEQQSWELTNRLVEALEEPERPLSAWQQSEEESAAEPMEALEAVDDVGKAAVKRGLQLLLDGDGAGFVSYAKSCSLLPESLVEKINESVYDFLGDIAIEDTGGMFSVIEEYRQDMEEYVNE